MFVFLSMTAYFMQELILEPYAGLVFGFTPGQSTSLVGRAEWRGVLGMLAVGIAATGLRLGSLRAWVMAGCVGSALALAGIAAIGPIGPGRCWCRWRCCWAFSTACSPWRPSGR